MDPAFMLNKQGRYIVYNPEIHDRQGQDFTISELEYLCRFIEADGSRKMSYALGRTEQVVNRKIRELKRNGQYEFFKNLRLFW